MRTKRETVFEITSARRALSEDTRDRNIRYLVSMSIRTACFFLMVITPSPWRWAFAVAAVVLPWFSVMIANGGRELPATPTHVLDPDDRAIVLRDGEYLR